MALDIPALVMMVVFYMLVLGIGIFASVKSKKLKEASANSGQLEVTFLANRGVSVTVGVFTMTGECTGTSAATHLRYSNVCRCVRVLQLLGSAAASSTASRSRCTIPPKVSSGL